MTSEGAPPWHADAACRDHPVRDQFHVRVDVAAIDALRICGDCSVRTNCLDQALATPADLDYGVWGGTTRRQRRAVRRGTTTMADALDAGDALAAQLTLSEDAATREPWLLLEDAS